MPNDVDIFIDAKDQYSDRRDEVPYIRRIGDLEDRVQRLEAKVFKCKNPNCGCQDEQPEKPDGGG